jgi:hypothetical protein
LKENPPFSESLRIRRICSTKDELEKHNNNLFGYFTAKGYSQKLISKQIYKASAIPREHTLTLSTKMKLNRIPMITTFHDRLPPLSRIINNRTDILTLNAEHKQIFKEPFVVAFRRPKNISDLICSNKIINDTVSHKISPPKTIQFCQPCNIKNSLCCKYVTKANSFTSRVTQISYHIFHSTNCRSKFIIYLLECTKCQIQYIGKSTLPLNYRLNNYRHRINSAKSYLTPAELHFSDKNHNFDRDAKFKIIEQIENTSLPNINNILLQREDSWILKLKTLTPQGLNSKLNNPDQNIL